jgi:ABC-type dipeptide/oligopeptide/nickel transport system permease subunit
MAGSPREDRRECGAVRLLWRYTRWVGNKLFFLLTLLLATLVLLMAPAMLVPHPAPRPFPEAVFSLEPSRWLSQIFYHLNHLLHGRLLPPVLTPAQESMWRQLPEELLQSMPITLKLVGSAFLLSMVLGLVTGWGMSRLGPRWFRRSAWGATSALSCLPDLLIATALDLALVVLARSFGLKWTAADVASYQHFVAPVLALTLLVLPFIARVTANAIEEIAGELYVRTAVAKGLHPGQVVVKHIGRSVLVKVWTALPVVASLLISGTAVVEYMMEIHGLGRALVLAARARTEWYPDSYVMVFFLLPLLLIFTLVSVLSDLGIRFLDPRLREPGLGMATGARTAPQRRPRQGKLGAPEGPRWFSSTALRQAFMAGADAVSGALTALPGAIMAGLRALKDPVLLSGTLLVAGLLAVAILAPYLAPHDPNRQFQAFQDAQGRIFVPPFRPGPTHLLGTDGLGRDVFSRLIYGTRFALALAGLAVPARFFIALALGAAAAWRGGIWSRLIDWLNVFFTAVPQVLVPLALLPMFNQVYSDQAVRVVSWGVLLVALPGIPRLASSIRQLMQTVLSQPFLEGALAVGARPGRVVRRHILPHMAPQLITMLVAEVPAILTLTAVLAYFRVSPGGWVKDEWNGGGPRLPEWGSLMELPLYIIMANHWWMWAPFVALFIAILGFNLLGEGLRRHWSVGREWTWE